MATPPYTSQDCEFYLSEFFVMRPFRGKGISGIAAKEVFNHHTGNWGLQTNPTESNKRAQHFWRKTLNEYTGASFQEECSETTGDGLKMIYRFDNRMN